MFLLLYGQRISLSVATSSYGQLICYAKNQFTDLYGIVWQCCLKQNQFLKEIFTHVK